MKKIFVIALMLGIQAGFAQKIAYIEMDKILDKMPAYQKASDEIDKQAEAWQSELDAKFESIESMYQEYVKNQANLSDQMKQQKQDAIFEAEKQANEFKEEKFGMDGEMASLQDQKFKPVYDQVFASAEKVAKEKNYDYVFDKDQGASWIYTNPDMDITSDVIKDLGLSE